MTTVRRLQNPGAPEWTEYVEHCNGNALHLPQVHFLELEPRDLTQLVFERGGEIVACGVAFASARRLLGVAVGSKALHLPTVPAIRDLADTQEIYDALCDYARNSGFSRLVIEPRWGHCFDESPLFRGFVTKRSLDFVLDLRVDFEQILAGMHKTHRKNIRRAERTGMTIELDSSLAGLSRLREMQASASERATEKGRGFEVGRFDAQKAHAHVYSQGIGQILFAKLDAEYVAGLAYLVGGKRVITVRSGSSARGYETRAMYLLYLDLIRRAREGGCVEVNFGAVPFSAQDSADPSYGLFEFKKGFGGTPMTRTGVDMVL